MPLGPPSTFSLSGPQRGSISYSLKPGTPHLKMAQRPGQGVPTPKPRTQKCCCRCWEMRGHQCSWEAGQGGSFMSSRYCLAQNAQVWRPGEGRPGKVLPWVVSQLIGCHGSSRVNFTARPRPHAVPVPAHTAKQDRHWPRQGSPEPGPPRLRVRRLASPGSVPNTGVPGPLPATFFCPLLICSPCAQPRVPPAAPPNEQPRGASNQTW